VRAGVLASLVCVALALLAGAPALAQSQVVSERAEQSVLTIYQSADFDVQYFDGWDGLALVTEWRTIDLPAGESRIGFRGVAEGMIPQTAAIDGLPAQVVERNQDYDLLSPGSLVARSLGQPITRIRTNARTGQVTEEKAILRSGPNGVILEVDGRFEALGCGGEPERLVFDHIPDGLADKPTLSMLVRAPAAGRYRVRLTYLATGVDWRANYVAAINPDGRTMSFTGWITLSNATGTSFAQAPTQVVAGDVERDGEAPRATVAQVKSLEQNCWPIPWGFSGIRNRGSMAAPPPPPPPPAPMMMDSASGVEEIIVTGSRIPEQTDLGDYKLYTLPYPTTVAARQTKQVLMLAQPSATFDITYEFASDSGGDWPGDEDLPASIVLRTVNAKDRGLGLPLPKGDVTITETDPGGALVIAGETRIPNTGVGAPVKLDVAESYAVLVRPRLIRNEARGRTRTLKGVEAVVINTTDRPIAFEYRLTDGGARIIRSSIRPTATARGRVFALPLKPGETRTLTYDLMVED
jgi:hypothetical protein